MSSEDSADRGIRYRCNVIVSCERWCDSDLLPVKRWTAVMSELRLVADLSPEVRVSEYNMQLPLLGMLCSVLLAVAHPYEYCLSVGAFSIRIVERCG